MPKLYQVKNKPEVYILGKLDGQYHHITDEPTFLNLFGNFSDNEIEQVDDVKPIGDPIIQVGSLAKLVNDFLNKLKGRSNN